MEDNYSQWVWRERERERRLSRLPKCTRCNEPIQDEAICSVDGDDMCLECIYERFGIDISFRF